MPDTTEAAVRAGIVGTGDLGTTLGEQIRDHENGVVTALTDVNPEVLRRAGEQFDVAATQQYSDYEDMLDDGPIDVVVIATPHAFHYEQTSAALDREYDVLCEKPLTIDLDEARELVARSEASDEILMVGYQRHLFPPFVKAREHLHAADGKPAYIAAETTQEWISKFRDAWRANPDLSGGGQLYDTGSHLIDAVLWVSDVTPESVYAEMAFDDTDQRVDKHASLSVRFENGGVGSITVSGDTRHRYEQLHFSNDNGAVRIENQLQLFEYNEEGQRDEVPIEYGAQTPKGAAFIDAVIERTVPPATARHAMAVTAVTEAAYESARTGERVEVDLTL